MYKKDFLQKLSKGQISKVDSEFWGYLAKHAYPVTHGELRIPISLEPFIIDEEKYNVINELPRTKVRGILTCSVAYFEYGTEILERSPHKT
jgi:hypothetical protein